MQPAKSARRQSGICRRLEPRVHIDLIATSTQPTMRRKKSHAICNRVFGRLKFCGSEAVLPPRLPSFFPFFDDPVGPKPHSENAHHVDLSASYLMSFRDFK